MRNAWMLLPLALGLSACVPSQSARPDPYAALSGTYSGSASLGPFPAPYELLLNVSGRTGRADGVLTRLSNRNIYTATGTFRPYDSRGGTIDLTLTQGRSTAGTISARLQGGTLDGNLRTKLLLFTLKLKKAEASAPAGAQVTTTPTTTPTGETSVPVYVIPTPVTPPKP
ncbi:hypothetical protein [Deinococcus sp.]|uniref:hypothetical protein n=1 Tax=Deinococcus sp. TaxID=47478 RepID=UPI0025CB88E6|nr:hypothetical protein [Deinococcus sp.]